MLGKKFRLNRSFFVWASVVSTVCALLILFAYYYFGDAMSSPIFAMRVKRISSDFAEVLGFSAKSSPYVQSKTSYPPLAILLFRPLGSLCTAASKRFNADFLASPLYVCAYLTYFISSVILICVVLKKFLRNLGDKSVVRHAIVFFVFSGGLWYTFFRGNIIITALLFTLLFLVLKDSENKVLREISLICLALAGAIKIYPLIFGAFLLNRKRLLDSVKVGIYFCILFILPFLAFEGGLKNVVLFWENMSTFQYGQNRLFELHNMSVSGLISKLFRYFDSTPSIDSAAKVLSSFCTVLALVVCAVVAVFTKNDFRRAFFCASAVCIVPAVSYYYSTIFMLIPLIYYLADPCVKTQEESATLSDILHGRESVDQMKDVVFWSAAIMLFMAIQIPLRYMIGTSLSSVGLILGMTFLEIHILFNKISEKKQKSLEN